MSKFKHKRLCVMLALLMFLYTLVTPCAANACYTGDGECLDALSRDVDVSSRLFELFFGKQESKDENDSEAIRLYAGGIPFGIRLDDLGVLVSDCDSGSRIIKGDRIIKINDKDIYDISDVRTALSECKGTSLSISVLRNGEKKTFSILPKKVGETYVIGVTLTDGAAGIGTVTYIDPRDDSFGGLGHSVCDENLKTVQMRGGEVLTVVLGGIKRAESGRVGELCGILCDEAIGSITKNCECGVFGTIDYDTSTLGELYEIGTRESVCEGPAEIITTLKNGERRCYSIEIFDIDYDSCGSKSFKIHTTDETLTALSGGIVRGMSGSPIIQDGKLVGAVTHVMVADPTEGYGIFIENMLSAAENTVPKAA